MVNMALLSPSMPVFWVYFLYFFVAIIVAFIIPGLVTLGNIQKKLFFRLTIGCTLGMVLWGLQGIVFGYLNMRWMTCIYLLIFLILFVLRYKKWNILRQKIHLRIDKVAGVSIGIIIVGLVVQMVPIWSTGFLEKNGLRFLGKIPIDAMSYAVMSSEAAERIPPYNPMMTGRVMHNYHYFMNVIVGELVRVFRLPLLSAQLSYYPIFISLLTGLTAWVFIYSFTKRTQVLPWFLFWHYFAGDITASIKTVFELGGVISYLSPVLSDGSTFLVNLYRSSSFVVLLAGVTTFLWWKKEERIKTALITGILFGSLISIKVYTGIFAIVGLGCLSLYALMRKKLSVLWIGIPAVVLSLVLYLPVNYGAGGLYWSGFWRVENYMSWGIIPVKEPWLKTISFLTKQKRLLHESFSTIVKTLSIEVLFVLVYLAFAYGAKWIGFFHIKKYWKEIPIEIHLFFIPATIICILLGLFTMQTSGGGHTDNFLNIAGLIISFYAAWACVNLAQARNIVIKILLSIIILLNIIPVARNTFGYYVTYPQNKEATVITKSELEAISFLRDHTPVSSVILVDPENHLDSLAPYIRLLSERGVYLSSPFLLDLNNTPYADRKSFVNSILQGHPLEMTPDATRINYIYVKKDSNNLPLFTRIYTVYFENKEIVIFKFDPILYNK